MLPVLAVIAAAVLFGTTGTSQALGPDGTTPLGVGVARLAIGGSGLALAALPLAIRARRRTRAHAEAPPRFTPGAVALMAATGVCLALYQPLFFLGTARNGVAMGTVIALGSAPVLAGLLEWSLTRRRPTGWWILATALATVGVALLAGSGGFSTSGTDPLGILGSIGAGASFAVFANIQRRLIDRGWDPFTVVAAMGASSGLVGIAAVPFVDLSWMSTPGGLVMALWLGLGTTSLAYILFTWGLTSLTAATAATLTLAEPLTATLLGLVVLGERLAPLALLGIGVLAAGLVVLAWSSRAHRNPPAVPLEV
ncbi:carboxylate/amino acid/amine transporter [Microbacterium sediminicola]|uniref:Carboxylate/amino acid/amine transporter n=1 Tax=Microbacterium sediminicola TaxID=415210 RepID=A0ABN2I4Z8_9MICO